MNRIFDIIKRNPKHIHSFRLISCLPYIFSSSCSHVNVSWAESGPPGCQIYIRLIMSDMLTELANISTYFYTLLTGAAAVDESQLATVGKPTEKNQLFLLQQTNVWLFMSFIFLSVKCSYSDWPVFTLNFQHKQNRNMYIA